MALQTKFGDWKTVFNLFFSFSHVAFFLSSYSIGSGTIILNVGSAEKITQVPCDENGIKMCLDLGNFRYTIHFYTQC
jgi:hypothetical protein